MNRILAIGLFIVISPLILTKPDNAPQKRLNQDYGKLPLSFEVNQGQTDEAVKFVSRGNGYSLFLTANEAVMALNNPQSTVLRMRLVGANAAPEAEGINELPGKSNYFIGDDPQKWRTNVAHYAKARYREIYPGVDMIYYGNQRQLEYDFIVSPGADPKTIRLGFEDADNLEVDKNGDLLVTINGERICQKKPVIFQEANGKKETIEGRYIIRDETEVGFELAHYDAGRPLVIDPKVVYATYLGGSNFERPFDIAADGAGNAYITGATNSMDFPTANPFQPTTASNGTVFVTKLNSSGTALVFSTYLGGSVGETGFGIAVDSASNVYVAGITSSNNFPTTPGAFQTSNAGMADAFVAKLNSSGNALIYSTYLGGSGSEAGAFSDLGLAVDAAGNAYIAGNTLSTDFPTVNPIQATCRANCPSFNSDAFISKLNPTGTALIYSTYLGGSSAETGVDIAVDSAGNAYVAGSTGSTDFPTVNALQPVFGGKQSAAADVEGDAYVSKLSPAGDRLVYSTFLGGRNSENALSIAVDSSGNVYLTGFTGSPNFPTARPLKAVVEGGADAYVTKIDPSGRALVYSTYLGGNGFDGGSSVAVDSAGNAYIGGLTFSTNFPSIDPVQAAFGGGGSDGFITMINPAGSALVLSTYFGGGNSEFAAIVATDPAGNIYATEGTGSMNIPTLKPLQSAFKGGQTDLFILKIGEDVIMPPPPQLAVMVTAPRGGETLTAGTSFDIQFAATGPSALNEFTISFSTDGGATFPNGIGRVNGQATSIVWNIPETLQTTQCSIQATVSDASGNTASAKSGIFAVTAPPATNPMLQVAITFDPPPQGQMAPPQNVRVDASVVGSPGILPDFAILPGASVSESVGPLQQVELRGFNIFRVAQPSPGQQPPTAEQIVDDPKNLIGTVGANERIFNDLISTGKGDNFIYSITSFFGNGQQSSGSPPTGTNLPVIKNPVFQKGTVFIDAPGSFIKEGAMLIINSRDGFTLQFDASGARFTTPKKTPGSGGVILKKLVKKGTAVRLAVKNTDGKLSVAVTFTRR